MRLGYAPPHLGMIGTQPNIPDSDGLASILKRNVYWEASILRAFTRKTSKTNTFQALHKKGETGPQQAKGHVLSVNDQVRF